MGASIDASIQEWLDTIADTRSAETYRTYKYAISTFQAWLAEQHLPVQDVETLQTAHLSLYVDFLLKRRLSPRTRQQYIDVLCRWITVLVESGQVAGISNERGKFSTPARVRAQLERRLPHREPSVVPRMPDLRRLPAYYAEMLNEYLVSREGYIPSMEEAHALRTYLNLLRNQALITTLFSSGGRVNEVLRINTVQVFKQEKILNAVPVQGKGRKQRAIYLNAEAQMAIRAYLLGRTSYFPDAAPLFISHGPRAKGERLSDITAWRVVKEAAAALAELRIAEGADEAEVRALRNVSPHGLRHFFAQSMLDKGAHYKDVASALGQSSTTATEQVYARQNQDEILEIIATFAAQPNLD